MNFKQSIKVMQDLFTKYQIPRKINLSIQPSKDGGFVAFFPDLPGCHTQGDDFEELLENLNDAVLTYFNVPRKEARNIFNRLKLSGQLVAGTAI